MDPPLPTGACEADHIKKWETGKVRRPQAHYRAVLCDVFEATEAELGLISTLPAVAVEAAAPPVGEGDSLDDARSAIQHIVALDGQVGGGGVAEAALRLCRQLRRRLGDWSDKDILAVAAEAAEVAGWVLYDADRQDEARAMSMEALHLARLAGDKAMERFALANLSMQTGHFRQPGETLAIARSVLESGALTPRVRALFTIREGRGLALAGRDSEARDAFARARAWHQDGAASVDPPWTWWVDAQQLDWHEASALADLGDHHGAIGLFHAVVEQSRTSRPPGRYNALVDLLAALVDAGAWRDAEPLVAELPAYAGVVSSGRVDACLRQVAARARRRGAAAATLRDGLEELAKVLG
jgi:hypothetical protein